MRRFAKLPSRQLFWAGLACLGVTLLVGLALVSLAQPRIAGATAQAALTTPTATHMPASPTASHPGAAGAGGQASSESKLSAAPSWLVEGLVVLFLLLLGFSLILFPLAMRSSRIERSSRVVFSPTPLPVEKQVARLSQIAPARKAPLSRNQLQALQEAAREQVALSQQPTAHLAAVRIVDGVPVSMPVTEAETIPHLPAAPRSVTRPRWRVVPKTAADSQG